MAESEVTDQTEMVENEEKNLKHLDFVQAAAIYMVLCFSSVYEYAKENSGPLKLGVQTVEGAVKTVIGPVYEKFCYVSFKLLRFVDGKVDESLSELDRHVPSLVKRASIQARAVACEVRGAGVVAAAKSVTKMVYTKYEPTAKELYHRYEPMAEHYAVVAWRSLNGLPLFPQLAQIIVPSAAYWSEKYNQAVSCTAERGYAVACCLPLIPIERIGKLFDGGVNEPAAPTNGEAMKGH